MTSAILTSVFIYTILMCLVFWIAYYGKIRKGTPISYSAAELIPFYLVSRVAPLLMMQGRASENYIAFAADAAVMAAIYAVTARAGRNSRSAAALYMFCPIPVISIALGTVTAVTANIVAAAAALVWTLTALRKHREVSTSVYFPTYVFWSAGIFSAVYSSVCTGWSITEFKTMNRHEIYNAAAVLLAAAGIVMLITGQRKVIKGIPVKTQNTEPASYEPEKFGKKNIIHIVILTAVYAVTVFYQLGSHEAPETGILFNSNDPANTEYIIDLGEYKTVSQLDFFLGQESLRSVSVSAFDETNSEWISITTEEMKTAFAWNPISISWNIRYIGLVFSSQDTHVNELVILDDSGNRIIPVNASERPELFDEQSMYPEYPTYYYRMMFDEIYHGRTAYEFLHDLSIYENTHPPLGKTIISLGIAVFGMNPFGWRFMCAFFGTLLVPVIYIFVWKVSKRSDAALTGGILAATDFMHFTLSRIATIDIIVAVFITMMFFFMFCFTEKLRNKGKFSEQALWLLLSGISAGLAIATKWTGLYGAAGLAVIFFTFLVKHCASEGKFRDQVPYLTKLCAVCVVSFIIIPLAFYSLSYIQFSETWPDKNFIQHAVENSKSMLSYHSEVTDSHPYASPWYDWIIDKQPVLDAITILDGNKVSSVATFGNPLIMICGFIAFIFNVYLWRVRKNAAAQFLSFAYLSMIIPWLFIHRTVFIYQYFGCDIIMIILICNALIHSGRKVKAKEAVLVIASAALFVMFFPEISGVSVDRTYTDKVLEWIPSWIFE